MEEQINRFSETGEEMKAKAKTRGRIAAAVLVMVLLCLAAVMSGCGGDKATLDKLDDKQLGIDPAVAKAQADYRQIAIFAGEPEKYGSLVMILSINTKNDEAKIVSVYPSAYMQLTDGKPYKIRGSETEFYRCGSVWTYGGMTAAVKELNRNMDLSIRECVAIEWFGIEDLVNQVDGIEMNVTKEMAAVMNKNMIPGDQISKPGKMTLNGAQTVELLKCRTDKGVTGKEREARNEEVLKKILTSAGKMGIKQMDVLSSDIGDEMVTSVNDKTIDDLLVKITEIKMSQTPAWPYKGKVMKEEFKGMDKKTVTVSYYVPDTLSSNVSALHKVLFGEKKYAVTKTVSDLDKKIEARKKTLK